MCPLNEVQDQRGDKVIKYLDMRRSGVISVLFLTICTTPAQQSFFKIPTIDLDNRSDIQVVVDREKGVYLGHTTTVLLEDGKTILTVYPKGHGKGAIVYKRSEDGGKTWSERLPVPENWSTSQEVPTLHRVVDRFGKKRLIIWRYHMFPIFTIF